MEPGPPDYRGSTITLRHTSLGTTSLDEWSSSHRDLYLKKHNTYNRPTSMPPCPIRIRSISKRAAADPRLRPRGHWDQQNIPVASSKLSNYLLLILTIRSGSCLVLTILFRNTDIDTVQWTLSGALCPIYLRNRASGVSVNSTDGSTFWHCEGLCTLRELIPCLLVFSWFRLLSRSLPIVHKTRPCSEFLLKLPEASSG